MAYLAMFSPEAMDSTQPETPHPQGYPVESETNMWPISPAQPWMPR